MKINIKNRSRRLETISQGDILIFNDKNEIVEKVDLQARALYTKRIVKNNDKHFPIKIEKVAYNDIEKINPNSYGQVYDWTKRREVA